MVAVCVRRKGEERAGESRREQEREEGKQKISLATNSRRLLPDGQLSAAKKDIA
jgi:hypothetical protein